jgi:hypothetical protein
MSTGESTKPNLMLSFGDVTEKNLGQLKLLNSAVFPVKYNNKFYDDLLAHSEYCKLGTWHIWNI